MGRWLQRILSGFASILGLLIAVPMIVWMSATDPISTARVRAGSDGGMLLHTDVTDGPLGGYARVTLQASEKDAKPVEIELRRPFWSRHWEQHTPPASR